MSASYAVVGGGILGAAVARQLQVVDPDASVTVWEKEDRLAAHQTGRNSGVVHAGLYYQPGSLKATLCRRGVGMLREFCEEHAIAYALRQGPRRARRRRTGAPGRHRGERAPTASPASAGSAEELREIEPHVRGVGGLHSPTTAIVDFPGVTRARRRCVEREGGQSGSPPR